MSTHHPHTVAAQPDLSALPLFERPLPVPGTTGWMAIRRLGQQPLRLRVSADAPAADGATSWGYETEGAINPTLLVRRGEIGRVEIDNGLDEDTTVHWHGLHLPWEMDGHPARPIPAGGRYAVDLDVRNRASTLWYHPHPHGRTAAQVAAGLAGLLIVEDEDSDALAGALDLRLGETDLPLVIRDRRLDGEGRSSYAPDPMEATMGWLGDEVTVNGVARPRLEVGSRGYRFRLLNGSNMRSYRLALVDAANGAADPMTVIGVDGGLLEQPVDVSWIDLSPAERVELYVDFTDAPVGSTFALVTLGFDPMHHGMGSELGAQHVGLPWPADGAPTILCRIDVTSRVEERRALPARLRAPLPTLVPDRERTWDLTLEMAHGAPDAHGGHAPHAGQAPGPTGGRDAGAGAPPMSAMRPRWLMNGLSHESLDGPVELAGRTVERWILRNAARSMPHPMHLHGLSFVVAGRRNSPPHAQGSFADGRLVTDLGLKDTVQVWPGEEVLLDVDLRSLHPGLQRLMFHCHLLEHEDAGMMLDLLVE